MKNWTVRGKLLAGFGLVILVLIASVGTAAMKMAAMQDHMASITEDRYPKLKLANRIIQLTLDNGRQVRNAILTNDTKETETFIGKAEANRAELTKTYAEMDGMLSNEEGKRLFGEVKTAGAGLDAHFTEMYRLARLNSPEGQEKARQFLNSTFAPANNAFIKAAEALAKYQDDRMVEARDMAAAAYHSARIMLGVLLAVAIALSVAIAVFIARLVGKPLGEAMAIAKEIREGNLSGSEPPPAPSSDESLTVQRDLILMRDSLRDLVRTIHDNATSVSDSAHELSGMAQHVAVSAQRQSETTTTAAATLEQLTVSINHVADNADDASRKAHDSGEIAARGGREVLQSADQIRRVSDQVGETASKVEDLTGQVQEIGQIVTVIRDVADQTNLLALNAAIEAARAGEMGRGFAVVADEVRKLAERTTVSAQEITRKIAAIQRGSETAVDSMKQSIESVGKVSGTAEQASHSMREIEQSSETIVGTISAISSSLAEQRTASHDLAQRMEQVAQLSESNSATVEELATTSAELQALAKNLQDRVSLFRL
ncbi:methyl-accepting chemotaxis protein [Paludibacterium paludis]|uniref:Methyl-accepting chemotaxis protein n=1 Tax=Paludibacterium paludis TaxID=1225769 RepID=A0A918NXR5_9NEIS|nr:methyl-accepting chemotaxis protein [Paludibacterium paludis]GGY02899.1 methyl-accepting chemotaxis protein [Paludibacterium paludis]